MAVSADLLEAYARLTVRVGANVQPGQLVLVNAQVEHAPLVRAVVRQAYEAGARYVDVAYGDQHARRAMIEHADEEMLSWSPPWAVERLHALEADGGAIVSISGNPEPEILADLDGRRVGKARPRELAKQSLRLSDGIANWVIVACPTAGWAQAVFGEPDVDRLWDAVASAVRLDEPDPVAAWQEHIGRLEERANALNERRFDHLRFRGPGTDLTVGLFPQTLWQAALDETRSGIKHVANMPTEEIFASPDPARTEGVVRSTRPLEISRHGRPRPRDPLRGRPRRRGRRQHRRRGDARARRHRRGRAPARRGGARRRRLARRPDRRSSSSTRSSTRTRPATSRSERGSPPPTRATPRARSTAPRSTPTS